MRRGFSLIELLVVLTIAALAMGILMPVLSRARAASMQVECAASERQIAMLSWQYAQEHGGEGPPLNATGIRGSDWALAILGQSGKNSPSTAMSEGHPLLVCPATQRLHDQTLTRTYAMNVTGLAGAPGDRGDYETELVRVRFEEITHPGQTLMLLDSAVVQNARVSQTQYTSAGAIDFRDQRHLNERLGWAHGGGRSFNAAFYDGSTRSLRAVSSEWRTPLP